MVLVDFYIADNIQHDPSDGKIFKVKKVPIL